MRSRQLIAFACDSRGRIRSAFCRGWGAETRVPIVVFRGSARDLCGHAFGLRQWWREAYRQRRFEGRDDARRRTSSAGGRAGGAGASAARVLAVRQSARRPRLPQPQQPRRAPLGASARDPRQPAGQPRECGVGQLRSPSPGTQHSPADRVSSPSADTTEVFCVPAHARPAVLRLLRAREQSGSSVLEALCRYAPGGAQIRGPGLQPSATSPLTDTDAPLTLERGSEIRRNARVVWFTVTQTLCPPAPRKSRLSPRVV
jgi:hypothetical protein